MRYRLKDKIVLIIPPMSAIFSWYMNLYLLTVLSILAIFFAIGISKSCKNHESIWLFILVGASLIPTNIWFSLCISNYIVCLCGFFTIMKFFYIPLIFSILFCVEEIIFGVIGRIIWKEQKPAFE